MLTTNNYQWVLWKESTPQVVPLSRYYLTKTQAAALPGLSYVLTHTCNMMEIDIPGCCFPLARGLKKSEIHPLLLLVSRWHLSNNKKSDIPLDTSKSVKPFRCGILNTFLSIDNFLLKKLSEKSKINDHHHSKSPLGSKAKSSSVLSVLPDQ